MSRDVIEFVDDRLPTLLSQDVVRRLTLHTFRALLSYPTWNYVRQAAINTRSYQTGLDGALILLRAADEYKPMLTPKEHARCMQDIFQFILTCLDKLDRWEEYLQAWEQIRRNTNYAMTYNRSARQTHGERIEPFVLGEDRRTLYVHFLYFTSHRKSLIERKLERKRRGQKIGNLLHARPDELTVQDIEARLAWLKQCYEANRHRDA
jgi:hypothetical protein